MSLTRRLHMRLTRPASLCPFASRRSHCILFSLPSSARSPSLTLSLFLFDAFLCHPSNVHTLHPTSATEKEKIVKQMGHRVEQRERINMRADTYRGRINHRKIMHMTTTERLGNGERVRVAPSCTSIRVFLPLSLSLFLVNTRVHSWNTVSRHSPKLCVERFVIAWAIKRTRDIGLPTTAMLGDVQRVRRVCAPCATRKMGRTTEPCAPKIIYRKYRNIRQPITAITEL